MAINISDLAKEITKAVEEYTVETDRIVQKAVDKTANEVVKLLKTHKEIPVKTGAYKGSFKKKVTEKARGYKAVTVYAADHQWSLTHLLEKGHGMPGNQPDSKAYPHWIDAEEKSKTLYAEILEELKI